MWPWGPPPGTVIAGTPVEPPPPATVPVADPPAEGATVFVLSKGHLLDGEVHGVYLTMSGARDATRGTFGWTRYEQRRWIHPLGSSDECWMITETEVCA